MDWNAFDFDMTIQSFEYTKKAVYEMNNILDYKDFDEKDTEIIFDYLSKQMTTVLFGDYLKRYIYFAAEIPDDFNNITEDIYTEIIVDTFKSNNAPIIRNFKQAIRRILNSYSVHRDTVFEYGIGLAMSDVEVSDFLTKVILEDDFDMTNPQELIYWYCLHYGHRYAMVTEMNKYYDNIDVTKAKKLEEKKWNAMKENPSAYITDKKKLMKYLEFMKKYGNQQEREEQIYQEFMSIYRRAQNTCLTLFSKNDDLSNKKQKTITLDDIKPAEIEKVLCSGIPFNKQGNLLKMSASKLSKQFQQKRMSRQRINNILTRKKTADRFDLITLLFLVYAVEVEPDWPAERYYQFVEEMNDILERCDMMGLYPVNPYEAFILMCIVSEEPLSVFSEVLALSFEEE